MSIVYAQSCQQTLRQILKDIINNDVMREDAVQASADNEHYQAFQVHIRQLMDLYFGN